MMFYLNFAGFLKNQNGFFQLVWVKFISQEPVCDSLIALKKILNLLKPIATIKSLM